MRFWLLFSLLAACRSPPSANPTPGEGAGGALVKDEPVEPVEPATTAAPEPQAIDHTARVQSIVRRAGMKSACNRLNGCPMIATLVALGRASAPGVEAAFSNSAGDGYWRLALLTALGRMGRPESAAFLEGIVRGEEGEMTRTTAALALARLKPRDRRDALVSYAQTLDPIQQLPLVLALGYVGAVMGSDAGRALIEEHLTTPNDAPKLHYDRLRPGLIAVGRLRMKALRSRVETVAKLGGAFARREAATTLGRLRDLDAVPTLIALLEDDIPGVRNVAQASLEAMTGFRHKKKPEQWRKWWASRADGK